MKRIPCVALVALFMVLGCGDKASTKITPAFQAKKKPPPPTVCIQEGDSFYHRADCPCLFLLRGTAYPEADVIAQGYKPCARCVATNAALDPDYQAELQQEKQARERQEVKERQEMLRLQAARAEEERIAAQQQWTAYQKQLEEQNRAQQDQSVEAQRREREAAKLQDQHVITSDDAYEEARQKTGNNRGGVIWWSRAATH